MYGGGGGGHALEISFYVRSENCETDDHKENEVLRVKVYRRQGCVMSQ